MGLRPPGLSLLSLGLELERFFLGDLGLVGIAPGEGGSITHVPEYVAAPTPPASSPPLLVGQANRKARRQARVGPELLFRLKSTQGVCGAAHVDMPEASQYRLYDGLSVNEA